MRVLLPLLSFVLLACGGETVELDALKPPPAPPPCALPQSIELDGYGSSARAQLHLLPDGRCEETVALIFGHSHYGPFIQGSAPWNLTASSEGEMTPGFPGGMVLPAPMFTELELQLEHDSGVTAQLELIFEGNTIQLLRADVQP